MSQLPQTSYDEVEPPEWYDSQVRAYETKVLPWLQSIHQTHRSLEDVRLEIIEKMRSEVNMECDIQVWTTDVGAFAFDIVPLRNLLPWDPDRQTFEIQSNLLDDPSVYGREVIKTDKGMVAALRDGDPDAGKLWTPGRG